MFLIYKCISDLDVYLESILEHTNRALAEIITSDAAASKMLLPPTSRFLYLIAYLNIISHGVQANWQYKSRPDLSPPTLNITISHPQHLSPGYIFVAPYSTVKTNPLNHGPLQPGPYIFTTSGELVWSGFSYAVGFVTNFQAANINGQDVLFAIESRRNVRHVHGHGYVKIWDKSYRAIKEVRAAGHRLLDIHEFHVLDGKTALVESYEPRPYDLRAYGAGPASQWVVEGVFQEVDINSGKLVFEWRSLDHVGVDESVESISSGKFGTGHNSTDALDYFHINSVDRDSEHNYLISARHTSTIYKINGTTGDVIWRLGGKHSNFTLKEGVEFGLQHHARFISRSDDGDEIISIFDNSGPASEKHGTYANKSSGKIISLNTDSWTATLLQGFSPPDSPQSPIFAANQGSTQILLNGNAFINWGSAGAVTEYSSNGSVVFHAYLDSGDLYTNGAVQNYRAFKFNWTGTPHEDPAFVALGHGESTVLYVSWNGDTETRVWEFFGVRFNGTGMDRSSGEDGESKKRHVWLGKVEREGFETSFYVFSGSDWSGFYARSLDGDGKVLVETGVVGVRPYIYPYVPGRDDLFLGEELQTVLGM
ncbi:hypothetical protein BT63DRAFT_89791 [Microthyrium microscopicum]|uniref:ASST-domain-containing protein n=1 Tax=Microthyrium microscopicum TaxID=703497 RepID=A0A6A6TYN8_9PEZI|nr:hypothetical protein BT63DRAFT_89791 [Microthyrium microscopicum]